MLHGSKLLYPISTLLLFPLLLFRQPSAILPVWVLFLASCFQLGKHSCYDIAPKRYISCSFSGTSHMRTPGTLYVRMARFSFAGLNDILVLPYIRVINL